MLESLSRISKSITKDPDSGHHPKAKEIRKGRGVPGRGHWEEGRGFPVKAIYTGESTEAFSIDRFFSASSLSLRGRD